MTRSVIPGGGNWSTAIQITLVVGGALFAGLAFASSLDKKQEAAPIAAIIPPPASRPILSEGRIATYSGKQVIVSAEIAGPVREIFATERTPVSQGVLLARIDVEDHRAALREAYARAYEASVDAKHTRRELKRTQTLTQSDALPQAQLDRAQHDRSAAAARQQVAGAAAARLAHFLEKGAVKAPIEGVVLAKHVQAGEYVAPGMPLFTIADLRALRVEVEVDEFDANRVALGQSVRISAEGYDRPYMGVVEEIPDEVVARRIRPLDPGRPSDTRVLVVKVRFLEAMPFRLGQRVEVEISPSIVDLDSPAAPTPTSHAQK